MLTTELIKQHIDLFNCLGLDGGSDDENAKVLLEFDAFDDYPKGLVIHIASSFNKDIGNNNFKPEHTRSAIAVFLEGRGFIVNIIYHAWSETGLFKIVSQKGQTLLIKNFEEKVTKKAIKYEYDPQTKQFSYHNGIEIIHVEDPSQTEIDYFNIKGEICFDFGLFNQPSVNNERLVFMSLDDTEPAFFALKSNIIELLQNRKDQENIELKDGYWVEYPYPDGDEQKAKLFKLLNDALSKGGGYKEIDNICRECREWDDDEM